MEDLNLIYYLTLKAFCCQPLNAHIIIIILHLINSSNERPLFVPRDRPIFSRIGSKKVRIFFVLDDYVQVHFTIVFQR